jgi:glycosyltransferase involved in cell wall biosynthesis
MISVCMATYNGGRWIEQQLQSVLPQLDRDDEVVVVDDASSDSTVQKIKSLGDDRIRLFSNERNLGVDGTFERALSLARGSVLFLCDQDDIWLGGKVRRVMRVFEARPDVTLVMSNARIIDSAGRDVGRTYFGNGLRFVPGVLPNLVKSRFLGCAIAVRAEMRKRFIPFPRRIPGHDLWIGLVNEAYGKTEFLSEPLIGYRRHGNNLSPEYRRGLVQMIVWRWQLVGNLAWRLLRDKFLRTLHAAGYSA